MLTRRRFLVLVAAAPACTTDGPEKSTIPAEDTAVTAEGGVPPITPNSEFYVTNYSSSKVPPPSFVDGWTLTFTGLVDEEITVDLPTIQALGSQEWEQTLECISNYGSNLIGNAIWTGIPFSLVLASLGVAPKVEATHMLVHGGDGYWTSIPLGDIERGLAVVWAMNGEELPIIHGAPLRFLTPGRYGMKNPKWITSIEFVDHSVPGIWETVGWSDDCTYQINAWIHQPMQGTVVPPEGLYVFGSAFAGAVPIGKVEVSVDDGVSWEEAEITYDKGPNVWVLWRYLLKPTGVSPIVVTVRATTADGRVQENLEANDLELDGLEGFDARVFKS